MNITSIFPSGAWAPNSDSLEEQQYFLSWSIISPDIASLCRLLTINMLVKKGQNNKIINLHDKRVIYTSRFVYIHQDSYVYIWILMYISLSCHINNDLVVLSICNKHTFSLRHRKCGVWRFIHKLFVSKTRTSEVRAIEGFWHKQRVNKTPYKALSMLSCLLHKTREFSLN